MASRGWAPQLKPKATLALVHGHGEHTGRFAHVGAALVEGGYALLGFDLRGHGASGGGRGRTPSYERLLEDIADFHQQIRQRDPDQPVFLYGHSLGGNLVLNYVLRRSTDLAGVIVTGPWLKLAFDPPAVQIALARGLNAIAPDFSMNSGLNVKGLSHDLTVVNAYVADPLVHSKISPRLYVGVTEAGEWALAHADQLPLPLLLMHGGADPVTSAKASRKFAEKAGPKVTLRVWDGLYHEIHNEAQKAEVFQVMLSWLDCHLPG
jgi:alpha-beta hydrolase superfamily lysophospholipase